MLVNSIFIYDSSKCELLKKISCTNKLNVHTSKCVSDFHVSAVRHWTHWEATRKSLTHLLVCTFNLLVHDIFLIHSHFGEWSMKIELTNIFKLKIQKFVYNDFNQFLLSFHGISCIFFFFLMFYPPSFSYSCTYVAEVSYPRKCPELS